MARIKTVKLKNISKNKSIYTYIRSNCVAAKNNKIPEATEAL